VANTPKVVPITSASKAGKSKSIKTSTNTSNTIRTRTSGSGGGAQTDWAQSVETRLGELRTDVRNLLIAGGVVALALAGTGWAAYASAMGELRDMAVTQQEISGKLDTFDARVAGRIDLMEERLGPKSQTGSRSEQAAPIR
jgi:hypothetical protein